MSEPLGFEELTAREVTRITTQFSPVASAVAYDPRSPGGDTSVRYALSKRANDAEGLFQLHLYLAALVAVTIGLFTADALPAHPYVSIAACGASFAAAMGLSIQRARVARAIVDAYDREHPEITAPKQAAVACRVFEINVEAMGQLNVPGHVLAEAEVTRESMGELLELSVSEAAERDGSRERAIEQLIRHAAETAALRALAERHQALVAGHNPAEIIAAAKNRSLTSTAGELAAEHTWLTNYLDDPVEALLAAAEDEDAR